MLNEQPVLQDTSLPSLVRAIEDSQVAYQLSFAHLSGSQIHDTPDLLWINTGAPFDFYNGVFRCSLDASEIDQRILEIQAEFRRCQVPMMWRVGPSSRPADLGDRLLAHGFIHDEDEPGMALDLHASNITVPTLDGFEIQQVKDRSMLDEWVATWLCGAPAEVFPPFQAIQAQFAPGPDQPWHYALGLLHGRPVATYKLFFGAGVAALHRVVTRHEVRQRGIGTAMTLAALQAARDAGYRVMVLTASPFGFPIYRRLGFQPLCTISTYIWHP